MEHFRPFLFRLVYCKTPAHLAIMDSFLPWSTVIELALFFSDRHLARHAFRLRLLWESCVVRERPLIPWRNYSDTENS